MKQLILPFELTDFLDCMGFTVQGYFPEEGEVPAQELLVEQPKKQWKTTNSMIRHELGKREPIQQFLPMPDLFENEVFLALKEAEEIAKKFERSARTTEPFVDDIFYGAAM